MTEILIEISKWILLAFGFLAATTVTGMMIDAFLDYTKKK